MTLESMNPKKEFCKNELSRCLSAMLPEVVRVDYHWQLVDGERLKESAVVHCVGGFTRAIDITGMTLAETGLAVLRKFEDIA